MRTIFTAAMALMAEVAYCQVYASGSSSSSTSTTLSVGMPILTALTSTSSSAMMTTSASSSASYTTVTVDDCTEEPETYVTVTNSVTSTYCPLCTEHSTPPTHTTVYETVYQVFCPTGLADKTYTVTETCTGETPTWTSMSSSGYVPQGFTTTVTVCSTACGHSPVTATLTLPCPPTTTPTMAPTTKSSNSTMPAPTSMPPYPMPTPTTAVRVCPGPQCTQSSNYPMPATSPITPFPGAASQMEVGLQVFGLLAVGVAAAAFML